MLLSHMGLSLELLALVAGVSLWIWGWRNQGAGTLIATIVGLLVTVLAIAALVCTGSIIVKQKNQGMGMMSDCKCGAMQDMMDKHDDMPANKNKQNAKTSRR